MSQRAPRWSRLRCGAVRARSALLVTCLVSMLVLIAPATALAQQSPSPSRSLALAVARVTATDCSTATQPQPGGAIPIGVVHDGSARILLIGICIEAQGPFVFALDTGAPYSFIGHALASRLHLVADGRRVAAGVVGCTPSTDQPVQVTDWSAAGLELDAEALVSGGLGSFAPGLSLSGLLGSDVLQRFGAIRIDYKSETLAFESPESAAPMSNSIVTGPIGAPSTFDLEGTPHVDVGIDVLASGGRIEAIAEVRIRRALYPFVVDTGAALLAIGPRIAKAAHLQPTATELLSATNCHSTVPLYRGARGWRLGSLALRQQLILGAPVGPDEVIGLLGSPVLSKFGALVVDYAGGRLLLVS